MRKVFLIFSLIAVLGGCTTAGPISPLTNSAQKTLEALEQSIPAEHKTKTVKANLEALKMQLTAIPAVCNTESKPYKEQRDKWRGWTIALVVILFILFFKKL